MGEEMKVWTIDMGRYLADSDTIGTAMTALSILSLACTLAHGNVTCACVGGPSDTCGLPSRVQVGGAPDLWLKTSRTHTFVTAMLCDVNNSRLV